MKEELIFTGGIVLVTCWSYFLAYISIHINMLFKIRNRNTMLMELIEKHDFKMKRIKVMHLVLILSFLFSLLYYQFNENITWIVVLPFFIVWGVVLFYTMTAISMHFYRKEMGGKK